MISSYSIRQHSSRLTYNHEPHNDVSMNDHIHDDGPIKIIMDYKHKVCNVEGKRLDPNTYDIEFTASSEWFK